MVEQLIRKAVVFNPLDPDQKKLLEHAASRSNFSAYMKRLIQRDLEGGMNVIASVAQENRNDLDFDETGFI